MSNQKLNEEPFNLGETFKQKPEGNKSIIIDVLDDPEMAKTQEIDERIPISANTRFCTICSLEQPLRSKHCKE